jgi:hypothetical protein
VVHARAQEHQPPWPVDQCGEQVGGEHVDGEHVGEPVGGLDALGLKVDAGVVDHRVEAAGGVGLLGDLAGLRDAGKVADHHATGAGRGGAGVARPGGVAGVQHDLMAARDELAAGEQAEPLGGAGDQHAEHPGSPLGRVLSDTLPAS